MTVITPEADAFTALTRRPFIVIDTETTWVPDGKAQRLVSFAYTVVRGGIARSNESDHQLVNPGVPIAARSTNIHHITNEQVADLDEFPTHAPALHALLSMPGAIFVAHHASFDIAVLRNEFALAGLPMPTLPVVDTRYLPRAVGYAPKGLTRDPNLVLLANALGIAFTEGQHHDAKADVDATAEALLRLLQHGATSGTAVDIETLLETHNRGTTNTARGTGYISSREAFTGYDIDPEHLAAHEWEQPAKATMTEMATWWDRADECGRLLCPLLVDEVLAVRHLGPKMVHNPVSRTLTKLTDPGQAATIAGAVMRLFAPTDSPRQESIWWRTYGPCLEAAPRCSGGDTCPDCRRGDPCPLDVAHEYAAASLMYDDKGKPRLDDITKAEGLLADWSRNLPRLAGHVAWLAHRQLLAAREPQRAAVTLAYAEALGLHRVDPNLAVAVAYQLMGRGQHDEATELLTAVRRPASTNPADVAVGQALARVAAHAAPRLDPAGPTDPVRSRPVGRVRPNPYRVGP